MLFAEDVLVLLLHLLTRFSSGQPSCLNFQFLAFSPHGIQTAQAMAVSYYEDY